MGSFPGGSEQVHLEDNEVYDNFAWTSPGGTLTRNESQGSQDLLIPDSQGLVMLVARNNIVHSGSPFDWQADCVSGFQPMPFQNSHLLDLYPGGCPTGSGDLFDSTAMGNDDSDPLLTLSLPLLTFGSTAIDSATSLAYTGIPPFHIDIDGDPRVLGTDLDRGADEFVPVPTFRRGDANDDGNVDLSDAIFILSAEFQAGSTPPPCPDAADTNDDGQIDISDAVFLLTYLQVPGSPAPLAP